MKFLFIVNPFSGKRRSERVRATLEAELQRQNVPGELWLWDDVEAIEAVMQKAVQGGYSGILAAGGDGTLHHVAKRLVGTGIPVGIVPVGTGNAVAHHFHLPGSIRGTVEMLKDYKTIPLDVGRLNGTPFVGFFGIGIDAVVAHRFSAGNQRTFLKYFWYALRDYQRYKPELIRVVADGREFHCKPHLLSVMNTAEFGGGAKLAAGANAQDGLLDLIWVDGPALWQAPEVVWRIFQGKLDGAGWYHRLQAQSITLERQQGGPAQMDGEAVFTEQTIRIACEQAQLQLMVPSSYKAVAAARPRKQLKEGRA